MSDVKNVPELRFPGFEGSWERKPLSKVCEMKAGKFVKASSISETLEEGMYPCYGGNGLRGYTGTNTHNGLFPLIGRQGALCGNVQLASGEFHATEHAVVVDANAENESLWLYYQLDKLNLNRFATGQAQPGLSVDVIQKVKAYFPSREEQQKIADFLSSIDKKIEQLTEKHRLLTEYKKGVMQQIFCQQIRFKDDNGNEYPEWVLATLGNISKRKTAKNKDESINQVLTNSATQGIVSQTDYFDKDIANQNNLGGYYIVDTNDFVYNPRISVSAPVGPIKRNHFGKGVMSPLYTVFEITRGSQTFFERYFDTNLWHRYMNQVANFGARHDRMNVTTADFYNMPMPFPCMEEQQKIANFLTEIDQKIDQAWSILEQTKSFKKGLLQKMFI